MSPLVLEVALQWVGVAGYIIATALFAYAILFEHPERVKAALWATGLGMVAHGAGLLVRWNEVGHGPYMLKYEVLSSNGWISALLLLIFLLKRPRWSFVALGALPLIILMIGFGLFTNPEVRELPPTLRSIWLVFHILFNKLAVGAYLLSVATAVALLLKDRGRSGRFLDRLPAIPELEAYTARFIGFGFIFWTTTIAAGAIWANLSWGRYWGWDPIETWSLVTWLAYGSYLHLRRFYRLKATLSAWLALACFGVAILTIFIFPFLMPALHSAYFQ